MAGKKENLEVFNRYIKEFIINTGDGYSLASSLLYVCFDSEAIDSLWPFIALMVFKLTLD